MSGSEFPKRFDFSEAEQRIYQTWLDHGCFDTAYDKDGNLQNPEKKDATPFTIVIPPPNITGRLHMGHALNNTVQDILIRAKRMDGYDALWIPGTDHAGIATQTVVKKQLDAEGIDYREYGRDKTIERIWQWRNQYGDTILEQLKRMGCSCDWSRTRFTMDEGLNKAVRETFVRLYQEGLVYRGQRIVNWCPVDQTALSDDEVEKEDEKGKMYRIRYPFDDDSGDYLVVATTRPETLFGDVAVAVHPEDERYKHRIGQNIRLPLQGRLIPVIADEHANPEMGTGVVKITPAHDPNDFEVGLRHDLEQINVMHPNATLNDIVPEPYRGLDRYVARKKAIEELEELELLDGIDDHVLAIGRSYRSKQPIEFRLSKQWFVKMDGFAEAALQASGYVKDANQETGWRYDPEQNPPLIHLHPGQFEKVYFHWLSNIRDWCISRQIWWGHRIPAWYHKESGEILVAFETPEQVQKEPKAWQQEDDVLDTWFSSWLWPMSTLGWPEPTPDFERYYPTDVLSTAKDILFFWVARMNFAGQKFSGALPYKDVYLHSTVADERGITMSKSKGNGIDPVTIIAGATVDELKRPVFEARPSNMKEILRRIEKNHPEGFSAVGADAMRWTLVYSITDGQHVRLSLSRFTEGRNFVTKLWNAAGRIITALQTEQANNVATTTRAALTEEERWLLSRLDSTIKTCRSSLDSFDFGPMAHALYHLVWNDYAAWALELSKARLNSTHAAERHSALSVMGTVLADMLALLHPIIPFVTEELWSHLCPAMDALGLWMEHRADTPKSTFLINQPYPTTAGFADATQEKQFGCLQRLVVASRALRKNSRIKDSEKVRLHIKAVAPYLQTMIEQSQEAICQLAKLEDIHFVQERNKGWAAQYDADFEIYIDLAQYVDLSAEVDRLSKEALKIGKELASIQKQLSNPNFVQRAPAEKVEAAKAQQSSLQERLIKVESTKEELQAL